MAYLPSEEAQERLLRDLGELIAARGSAAFLTAPIVEPDRRFLPDAWNGDLASTQVLLRRLMLYAKCSRPIENRVRSTTIGFSRCASRAAL